MWHIILPILIIALLFGAVFWLFKSIRKTSLLLWNDIKILEKRVDAAETLEEVQSAWADVQTIRKRSAGEPQHINVMVMIGILQTKYKYLKQTG